MISNRWLCFACLLSGILCWGGDVFAQTGKKTNLTRDDVVIKRNKPTIYICIDRELMKKKKEANDDNLWLRIYNNTIWTIKFWAERTGTSPQLFALPNGTTIAALTNESIAFPEYQFESKKSGDEFNKPKWGDVGTANWLPSNISAAFKVPRRYFKDGALFLEFKYEWEFVGAIGHESNSPSHRVYLHINGISNISGEICY